MSDWTFPYRVGAGLAVFSALLAYELWTDPQNARRPREYGFLFGAALFALAYGALHDFVTWSISPDYFVHGKKIPAAADRFFPEVMQMGMMATWSVGLCCAALMLMANNPDKQGRSLPYRALLRLATIPVFASVAVELVLGTLAWRFGNAIVARMLGQANANDSHFFTVWAMHMGAYIGVGIGLVFTLLKLVRAKRNIAALSAFADRHVTGGAQPN